MCFICSDEDKSFSRVQKEKSVEDYEVFLYFGKVGYMSHAQKL